MSWRIELTELERRMESQMQYLRNDLERLQTRQGNDITQLYQTISAEQQRLKIEQLEKENKELKEKLNPKN